MTFTNGVTILDGGLGTTLEELFHQDISNTPLWSVKTVMDNPEAIIQAHLSFLQAGARVILTSTYQCAFSSFDQAGYSRADARKIMLKAVMLADLARTRFIDEHPSQGLTRADIKVALSLGPFGANLSPSQEYDGFYPPPYGPKEYSAEGGNCNAFDDDDEEAVEKSIDALARFHLEKLDIFASDPGTWGMIDYVAFETVPLVREVVGIRRAMTWLQEKVLVAGIAKPWWISCVFPNGRFPETERSGGPNLSARQVVIGAMAQRSAADGRHVRRDLVPTGLGINCTPMSCLKEHITEMALEVTKFVDNGLPNPLLVVYPGNGAVYDPVSRTWQINDGEELEEGDSWADGLCSVVETVTTNEDVWGGVLVGGCCRVGPDKIQALSSRFK